MKQKNQEFYCALIKSVIFVFLVAGFFIGGIGKAKAEINVWGVVGQAGFGTGVANNGDIVFNPITNEPYVVFADGTSNLISVMKYDGSNWVNVGNVGFNEGSTDFPWPSLAFNPITGEPYVAFRDSTGAFSPQETSVMKFDGTSWEYVGSRMFDLSQESYASIAFKPGTEEVYVMGIPDASLTLHGARIKKFNEITSDWDDIGGASTNVDVDDENSATNFRYDTWQIAFSPIAKDPYVLIEKEYQDDDNWVNTYHKIIVMKLDSGVWTQVGSDVETLNNTNGRYPSMSFNPDTDEPYVVYQYGGGGSAEGIKKFDGSNWVNVGDGLWGGGTGTKYTPHIAFDLVSNNVYVSYTDNDNDNKAVVATYDGLNWSKVGVDGFSEYGASRVRIAFDPITNKPYVMFRDGANSNKATVMKFFEDIAPTVTNVTSVYPVGTYGAGTVIPIEISFSENVNVTGTPQLALWVTENNRWVNYTSGSGTDTLVFEYTVISGDASANLDYSGTDALRAAHDFAGTIMDEAGNDAVLELATPNSEHSLGYNRSYVIDTTKPTISSVDSDGASYDSSTSSPQKITVIFDEDISYTPTITVSGDAQSVTQQGPGQREFFFNYAVPTDTFETKTITISVAQDEAGNEMVEDSSHTFDVDTNVAPIVGEILITPFTPGNPFIISNLSTISAPVFDTGSGINPVTCRYSVNNGASSAITVTDAYDSGEGKCIFTNVDTSQATGIAVSVEDLAGNSFDTSSSWVTNFIIDGDGPNAPTASPASGDYAYSQLVTINVAGDATGTYYTLNGSEPDDEDDAVSGPITINLSSDHDSVTLKAVSYDNVGNKGVVMEETYNYSASGAGDKMQGAFLVGDISAEGGDPTDTPEITFNVDFTLETGDATVFFPAGTEMTKTGGGNINMALMTIEDVTVNLNNDLTTDVAGAIRIGLPSIRLTFNPAITITIPVGTAYNGQTLNVYYQFDGETAWNLETTCLVSGGNCTFQTNHATKFASGSSTPSISSGSSNSNDNDDSCGKKCKLYKEYKRKYKSAANKAIYAQVKNLRTTNMAEFERLKAVYGQYKKVGNKEIIKLSLKTQNDLKLYKKYRGYKLYLSYKK
ncbi:MAG: chitobiase/beta-hexosaminidase C-terminal domain-containing protein [Candidatus Moraniibacteriota bacterium]